MRVGREKFDVDAELQQKIDQRSAEGKGLIGGDPHRRPAHVRWRPIAEHLPYFRLVDCSEKKRTRLEAFLSHRPLEIEIGFGSGEFLLGRSTSHPECHFLGFEVKRHLCRAVAQHVQGDTLSNLWISDDDARWALPQLDLVGRVQAIHVLYPDPWWKRKHQAKRLFRPSFVALVHDLLEPTGILHVRTDVQGYGQLVEDLVADHGGFAPNEPTLASLFEADPPTRREAFCSSIHRPIWIQVFRKT